MENSPVAPGWVACFLVINRPKVRGNCPIVEASITVLNRVGNERLVPLLGW
jgi:hypothetical protein